MKFKKIPFQLVLKAISKLDSDWINNSDKFVGGISEYLEKYMAIVESCGWTNDEWDSALLKHINENWEDDSQNQEPNIDKKLLN